MSKKHRGPVPKHGESSKGLESVEYRTWSRMKNRCTNPNDKSFHRYGGRGIAVCERWTASFPAFLADMGRRPSDAHSIDRIDNDGNYDPANCRWATRSEQNSNYSRNRSLTLNGETRLLSEWGRVTGIAPDTISARLGSGWTVEAALSIATGGKPPHCAGRNRNTHCAQGHEYTAENSGMHKTGWRFCRTCSRSRSLNYVRGKRAALIKSRTAPGG